MASVVRYGLMIPIIIVLSIYIPPSFASDDRVHVILEFNSTYMDFNLLYLKFVGYDFEVVEQLHNVMNGAVVSIKQEQLSRLRNEFIISNVYEEKFLTINLDKSLKLIGADQIISVDTNGNQLTGEGVRVAVVDTGIDYTHPDLFGLGKNGKVVDGYDFLEKDNEPIDTDGHGTLVAGIIAADGHLMGVAPKADLVAYRIASQGSYVSTVDMIRALDRAVDDNIDVINISLGLDYISQEIDNAIEKLVSKGIVVVAAAGNNGQNKHIGSPASAPSAISVGASFNNVKMSAVSTLKIDNDNRRYDAIPMVGSPVTSKPISGKLIFGKFATTSDFESLDVRGAIVLAERGGPMVEINGKRQAEIVYFTDKEMNAARNGAAALIVYNNEPGPYYGTLLNDNVPTNYKPRIPVVSLSLEEGLMLKDMTEKGEVNAELELFYNPDVVAPFSSRGQVSPFYLKPTLVAPGAFVNSTTVGKDYSITSGTSFAAPHVTGAVALMLQKNPGLKPNEIASILATTAKPVKDAYGVPYSFDAAGAGRLDIKAALESDLIAMPYSIIIHLSMGKEVSKVVQLKSIDGKLGKVDVSKEWEHHITLDMYVENVDDMNANIVVNAKLAEQLSGKYEGRILVENAENRISIPVIVYADGATIGATNKDGRIWLSIDSLENWTFAKVKIMNVENRQSYSVTLTPSNNIQSVPARSIGEHWIEADVVTNYGDVRGFSVLYVNDISTDGMLYDYVIVSNIPFKGMLMVTAFLAIAATVTYAWTRRVKRYVSEVTP
ncbi:MAG: S8 family serine peptidase [Nitrososphaerales archaeon]